ncbi:Anthranilate synthase component II, partial [Planctomyces bekefii]
MRMVMIDNYDSFTFNLVQYFQELGVEVQIVRNDQHTVAELLNLKPDFFVISPGPSTPDQAGVCLDLIRRLEEVKVPLLGVCLGHQAMGQALGGKVIRAPVPMHGKVALIHHKGAGLFQGLPTPLEATRYHSLIVERSSLPSVFEVTAWTDDGLIMAMKHKSAPMEGVQFHPESVLTKSGMDMLRNFVATVRHSG